MNTKTKWFKRGAALLLALTAAVMLCACDSDKGMQDAEQTGLTIVCSIYPVYDFACLIARDHAAVYQLLPPGTDSHDYEPSVGDIVAASRADLFIYTDDEMERWIGSIMPSLNKTKLLRCAAGIDLEALNEQWEDIEHENEGEDEEHGHHHEHRYDAHIWLDPTLAIAMCENIREGLISIDPANAEDYTNNCRVLTEEMEALDRRFEALFARHPGAMLSFGGKFSYSHFIRRYNVRYLSVYESCGEEEEVSLPRLIEIIRQMKTEGNGYIFTDELSGGLIAREIRRETGAEILLFHSCHSVSGRDAGLSYMDLMNRNYENVMRALGEE